MINHVLVLGGGSAGFLAALSLKIKLPDLDVTVLHSRELGIIGVGEGTTFAFPNYLHGQLRLEPGEFHRLAEPSWKLGIRFTHWGPRPFFDYTFRPQVTSRWESLPRPNGYYSSLSLHPRPGHARRVRGCSGSSPQRTFC